MARDVPFKFEQREPTSESRHGGAIRRRAGQFSAPSFELEQLPREVASGFHTVCRAAIDREWDRMSQSRRRASAEHQRSDKGHRSGGTSALAPVVVGVRRESFRRSVGVRLVKLA
jgi:hypothetical protein